MSFTLRFLSSLLLFILCDLLSDFVDVFFVLLQLLDSLAFDYTREFLVNEVLIVSGGFW